MRAVDQQGTFGNGKQGHLFGRFLVGLRLNQTAAWGFEFKLSVTPQDSSARTGSGLSFAIALAVLRSDWGRLQVPPLKARNPINVAAESPHENWHLQGCHTYIYHHLSGRQLT